MWKFNAFNLHGYYINEHWCIYSCLQIPPRENWFQYIRIVIATAINFPCILTLVAIYFSVTFCDWITYTDIFYYQFTICLFYDYFLTSCFTIIFAGFHLKSIFISNSWAKKKFYFVKEKYFFLIPRTTPCTPASIAYTI